MKSRHARAPRDPAPPVQAAPASPSPAPDTRDAEELTFT